MAACGASYSDITNWADHNTFCSWRYPHAKPMLKISWSLICLWSNGWPTSLINSDLVTFFILTTAMLKARWVLITVDVSCFDLIPGRVHDNGWSPLATSSAGHSSGKRRQWIPGCPHNHSRTHRLLLSIHHHFRGIWNAEIWGCFLLLLVFTYQT